MKKLIERNLSYGQFFSLLEWIIKSLTTQDYIIKFKSFHQNQTSRIERSVENTTLKYYIFGILYLIQVKIKFLCLLTLIRARRQRKLRIKLQSRTKKLGHLAISPLPPLTILIIRWFFPFVEKKNAMFSNID